MGRIGAPQKLLIGGLLAMAVVAAVGVAWRATADQGPGWTVESPGGGLTARILPRAGTYQLMVMRNGRRVLSTPLGRADAGGEKTTESTLHERFTTPAGKRRRHAL